LAEGSTTVVFFIAIFFLLPLLCAPF